MSFDFQKDLTFFHVLVTFALSTSILMFFHLFLRKRQHLVEKAPISIFVPRGYTVEELSQYDAVQKPWAFVGVKGVIYNCSLEWYGKDSPYNAFAGRDSSRHLGKMTVSREEANVDWTTLSASHLSALNEWEERLRSKYVAVGWLIPNADFLTRAQSFSS